MCTYLMFQPTKVTHLIAAQLCDLWQILQTVPTRGPVSFQGKVAMPMPLESAMEELHMKLLAEQYMMKHL
nr:hypothetical protein Iba_chr12aCG15490 [Ipomoea batatas]GME10521.1 hypothetical protein Iba_scaffold10183CG0030 [Ipomoea batatas]